MVMQITIEIPDDLAATLSASGQDPARAGAGDGTVIPAGADDSPAARDAARAAQAARAGQVLAMLEHQILAAVLQIVSGPGGVASFLRRNLLGKGLNGPSLPLDVGQP